MKRMLAGLAAVLITTSAALAVGRFADTSVGKVYVNDRGMTLYMLSSDRPNYSTCYAKCAQIWPPYKAAAGAKMKRGWSIVVRQDGSRMWAYRGHPLYAFFKDRKPGDVYGNGMRDQWGAWRVAAVGGAYIAKPVASYHPKAKAGGSYGGMSNY
jgi:predicted lipoprotein with Yx(FWY)xxD motif